MLKPLPVGIQTFRKLIEQGYLYVDKTREIYRLVTEGEVYFLSRPRRFGKSLLLSTLEAIFTGQRELFAGLWIEGRDYTWEEHPVVRVDFSLFRVNTAEELTEGLQRQVSRLAEPYQVRLSQGAYYEQFADLIRQLGARNKVVVLVDEYDKPIIDNLENEAEARWIREVLKGFYGVLKGLDEYLRFVLLTGVSKFSKVGVFSGLNNLEDLTLSPAYAGLLGITEEELGLFFAAHIADFAAREGPSEVELRTQIRHWYNGFCFAAGKEQVYNPFSLLLLFKQRRFANYWFESGTPTFLIELLKERGYDVRELEDLQVDELAFNSYEVENLRPVPLLLQTGYLTIKGYDSESRLYTLSYPNFEVENAFLHHLLSRFSGTENGVLGGTIWQLSTALRGREWERFFDTLQVFFADIPYDIQLPQERYYQTVFYLIFKLLGLRVGAEVRTHRGRIDAVVELSEGVFVFEFKVGGTAEVALAQIAARGYVEPYRQRGKPVYSIGVAFGREERGIVDWQVVETA